MTRRRRVRTNVVAWTVAVCVVLGAVTTAFLKVLPDCWRDHPTWSVADCLSELVSPTPPVEPPVRAPAKPLVQGQLTVSWTDNSGGTATTRVERRLASETRYTAYVDLPAGANSYVDTSVAPGTSYCYRARAWVGDTASEYSEEACAVAAAPTGSLSVAVSKQGGGAGTVTSAPSGISCGAACIATFGATVTLSAAAAAGSVFDGWSGGGCSGTAPCTIAGNAPVNVTASFSPAGAAGLSAPAGSPAPASGLSVTLTAPPAGATVSDTVAVTASTSGPVKRIDLFLDGARVARFAGAVAAHSWKTTRVRNGVHRWTARAYDAAGAGVDSAPVDVTVENVVSVQLTAPSPGATVEGTVTVSAVASGNVSRVVLVLDGRRVTGSWGTTHSYAWKTVQSPNGVHRWIALAFNRSTRQWQESAPVDVTVNNP